MADRTRPPEELSDGRISLRRFRTADAPSLHESVTTSLDHLAPWMPWLSDGVPSQAAYRDLIDDWWEAWSTREIFAFRVCDPLDPAPTLGSCGLHARIGPGGLELGYWIRVDQTRAGLATAAARLAAGAALTLDSIDRVEIHHDIANTASRRIPEALGFERVAERDRDPAAPAETGREVMWRTTRDEWADVLTREATSDD